LRFQDITAEGLVIRETKFRKSRLVWRRRFTRFFRTNSRWSSGILVHAKLESSGHGTF
jgi:hypothetical protein